MLGRLYSLFYREPKVAEKDANVSYHSQFGGFWTDRLDASEVLQQKISKGLIGPELADQITFFIENGYVILRQAVKHTDIDNYLAQLLEATKGGSALRASVPVAGPQDKGVVALDQADINLPLTKVLDTYQHLPTAHAIIFANAICAFLRAVFEDNILAFQGLHFEKGSTQAIHQDTAYVVLTEPMKLCASWVALEDVQTGSGELVYYPGSHRLPDWLYSKRFKHFNHKRDEHTEHLQHLESLHEKSRDTGLKLQSFLPRKGDVLIWSADLAHGGAPISDSTLTRRSLVTHYTAQSVTPYYSRYKRPFKRRPKQSVAGCSYTSLYYN